MSDAVALGGSVAVSVIVGVQVEVDVDVGKGVKVCVTVGGAKVGVPVPGAFVWLGAAEGGRVKETVGLGGRAVAVAEGVAVALPGALPIATKPAQ